MKRVLLFLMPVIMVMILSGAEIRAAEAEEILVKRILSADHEDASTGGIITDQTGDYVSVYLVGTNLSKGTVKPVFYDDDGNIISGEVNASEQSGNGAYFSIEKLPSEAWDLKNDDDGKKIYQVEVQATGDKEVVDTRTDRTVEIKRRDMYYHCHNNNNCTISMYLAADLNLDESHIPVMKLEPKDEDLAIPKQVAGKMVKEVNPLTGAEETKAVFEFTRSNLANIRDTYSYVYTLAISDGDSTIMEIPNKLGDLYEYEGETVKTLENDRKEIFYLPYWIGGVYEIDSTREEGLYYLTKEDVAALGEFMYSSVSYPYGEYELDDTDHSGSRIRFEYNFFEALDLPEKPVGKPKVTLEKVDKDHVRLSWTAVEGVTEYRICVQKPGETKLRHIDGTKELTYVCDISNFSKIYGEVKGDFLFSIVPIAKIGEYIVYGEQSDSVLYTVVPQIEGVDVKGYSANHDGKSHTITVSGLPKGAKITYATSEKGKYTTTKPKRTKIGVTKVYYKVQKEGYETLAGMVKIVVRPKATTKVTTSLYKYNAVQVKWNKVSGASGYAVYFKKSSAKEYTLLKRTTALSLKKASLTAGTKYVFKVVPYVTVDGVRYLSKGIKTSSIYTLKKVTTPTVSKKTSSKVRVKWKDINGERGYQISRSTSSSKTNIVATFKTPKSLYKDISATKGKTYYYKVRAYVTVDGKKIYGPWSATKKYKI